MNLANLLRLISLRRLRLQKTQTILAASGICLGVTAIVAVGIVNKSVLSSYENSMNYVTGRAKIQVTGAQSGFPEEIVDRVRAVPGVECAVPAIDTDGLLSKGKERAIMILGVDVLTDGQIRDYSLTGEGSEIPDPLLFLAKPDSILITRTLAEREGIVTDQAIEVETVHGTRTFRVRGILNPEGPARVMGGNLAVMDIYAAQTAFGKKGRIDRIDVSLVPGSELETVKEHIRAALPDGYTVDTPAGRTRQIEIMLSKFQTTFNLVSFLAIFVGMYLIYNAVSISVVNRRREIGILRALGTTRGEVIRLFMGETLMISIIGSLLGVGLGILFAQAVSGIFGEIVSERYLRTAVTEISISWLYPVTGLACGIIASLVAAFFPALAGSRVTPITAIRSVPYSEEGFFTVRRLNMISAFLILLSPVTLGLNKATGVAEFFRNPAFLSSSQLFLLLGISLATPAFLKVFLSLFHRLPASCLGSTGRLAGLNLRKNIKRNAVAVAAIFYGIAVFVGTAGFLHSIKESTMTWLDAVVCADIIVSSGHPVSSANARTIPMPVDMLKDIETIPGVRSADPWRKVYMDYKGKKVLLSTIDIARRLAYSPYMIAQGERRDLLRLLPHQDYVAVSEPFAARYGIKPGDSITLPATAGAARFEVAAVIVDYLYDGGTILMDINTYQRHWGDMLVDAFSVLVKPGEEITAVRAAILGRLGGDRKLFVLPALEFKNEIRKALDGTFIFNYAVNVITLTVACFGIVITMLASVLERTREIGILRSIGMLRRQVAGVVVVESVIMGLAGGILGSTTGIIMGWFNLEGFFRAFFGTSFGEYYIPYDAVVWAIILSIVISALAGLYPARRAANTDVMEALTYE